VSFRIFLALPVLLAVTFVETAPARAWGCLAVTPWVNRDRSIGWSFDATERRSRAAVAQVALSGCERRRRKVNPQYPACFLAGCAQHVKSAAEAMAISPP